MILTNLIKAEYTIFQLYQITGFAQLCKVEVSIYLNT